MNDTGDKMRQFRKLEPGDASKSEPDGAQESSIADPSASQILDEQELLDLLRSDTVSDLSTDNGQGDNETIDPTDTFISYDELTTRLNARSATSQLRREKKARESDDLEVLGATSGVKVYPFVKTRVSWIQRVLSWFRRN